MDADAVGVLDQDPAEFAGDVFRHLAYEGQREYGGVYLRGLMLEGKRKSIEPIAKRLGIPRQNLGRFIGQSAWNYTEVMRTVAARAVADLTPRAWIIDDHPIVAVRQCHGVRE